MNTISNLSLHADGQVRDLTTGNTFRLSPTGLVILRLLMQNQCNAEIVEQLALKFHMTIGKALCALSEVRGCLLAAGLL